jgi:hypothetical protein
MQTHPRADFREAQRNIALTQHIQHGNYAINALQLIRVGVLTGFDYGLRHDDCTHKGSSRLVIPAL